MQFGICRNCVQLLTSTEVYSFSGLYYVLYKRGLSTTATRAIKTINNYIVICFLPDELILNSYFYVSSDCQWLKETEVLEFWI